VFIESIPFLQKAGIKQYLLEVLQHNEPAVSVYRKMQFKVSREFNYFISESSKLKLKTGNLPAGYSLKQINPEQVGDTSSFWDYTPSWQNSFEAIYRKPDDFLITAAFINDQMIGYGILEPSSGDITQLAVHPLHRRKGIGTVLLEALLNNNRHSGIKAINTDISSEASTRFFEASGLLLKGKQFEMIKEL
jgi:ribosomal protein S18 acetylase RimI-like enzyme